LTECLTGTVPAVKTGRMGNLSIYNVRKLYFQENICEAFAEDKSSTIVET